MKKSYVTAQSLLQDSFELAAKVIESGFKPDLIVGVWRGGSPIAIAIHEAFNFVGIDCDHIPIKTKSYIGIATRSSVEVSGLEYIQHTLRAPASVLLVDDVFDTGLSMDQVIYELDSLFECQPLNIKIAVPYYKPSNNKTQRTPDFFLHKSSDWIVFPHEIQGLSINELNKEKPDIGIILQRLLKLRVFD